MDFHTITLPDQSKLSIKESHSDKSVESFAEDVLQGLSSPAKTLPPKYFYDQRGSELFEEICELPEYYPTRTERSILQKYAEQIVLFIKDKFDIVELGSGSSVKTRLILKAFLRQRTPLHYMPIDISKNMLVESSLTLLQKYNGLRITALASDYFTALKMLKKENQAKKLILFLGSSIGNFNDSEQVHFLTQLRSGMDLDDRLLLGMDLMKDESILIPAYDDAQGVTASFNKNILRRMNDELDADFDIDLFKHKVLFNKKYSRIEMHLQSLVGQTVTIGQLNKSFNFARDETIHTENSYKFTKERIRNLAATCGFQIKHAWYDSRNWFSLNLFKPQ